MANVIKNLWDKVTIYCENHAEPVKMELISNTELIKTPFLACTHEHPCSNRLNMDDYQGICLKLMKIIDEDPFANLKNSRFDYKGARQKINIRILKYNDHEIRLGILNRTVLGK